MSEQNDRKNALLSWSGLRLLLLFVLLPGTLGLETLEGFDIFVLPECEDCEADKPLKLEWKPRLLRLNEASTGAALIRANQSANFTMVVAPNPQLIRSWTLAASTARSARLDLEAVDRFPPGEGFFTEVLIKNHIGVRGTSEDGTKVQTAYMAIDAIGVRLGVSNADNAAVAFGRPPRPIRSVRIFDVPDNQEWAVKGQWPNAPSIAKVEVTPGVITGGFAPGTRAQVTVTLRTNPVWTMFSPGHCRGAEPVEVIASREGRLVRETTLVWFAARHGEGGCVSPPSAN